MIDADSYCHVFKASWVKCLYNAHKYDSWDFITYIFAEVHVREAIDLLSVPSIKISMF